MVSVILWRLPTTSVFMSYLRSSESVWVPLPAPGAPSRTRCRACPCGDELADEVEVELARAQLARGKLFKERVGKRKPWRAPCWTGIALYEYEYLDSAKPRARGSGTRRAGSEQKGVVLAETLLILVLQTKCRI